VPAPALVETLPVTPRFSLELSDGGLAAQHDRPPLATATPLGEREAAVLLARLPPLHAEPDATRGFTLTTASQPPPRTGVKVLPALAPGKPAPPAAREPLRVLRISPDSDVSRPIRRVSVTFSQPMVRFASRRPLRASEVPIQLSPQPPGEWSWEGPQTLVFRAERSLPMATAYTIIVPPGITAASGERLSEKTGPYHFTTPPPRLEDVDRLLARGVPILLEFDQRIAPEAVLTKLRMTAGQRKIPLELVSEPAASHLELRERIARAEPGCWLLVRPTAPLPPDGVVELELAAALPSAEGPLRTTTSQSVSARMRKPLTVDAGDCLFYQCELRFSDSLDEATLTDAIRIEPEVPRMQLDPFDRRRLWIYGEWKARTKYKVTIAGTVADRHGQQLGKPVSVSVQTGAPYPSLPHGGFSTLDPAAGGLYQLRSTGYRNLAVRVHAVTPADWDAYIALGRREDSLAADPLPGRQLRAQTLEIADPDQETTTPIDLGDALRGGVGHALVSIEGKDAEGRLRSSHLWIQATRIGLDTFVDATRMIVFASDLASGKPLRGVQLQLIPGGAQTRTDADGLASLPLAATRDLLLQAMLGDDIAMLVAKPAPTRREIDEHGRRRLHFEEPGWHARPRADELLWYVFDDRRVYRPGETARVKGWLRREVAGPRGGVALPGAAARQLRWALIDRTEKVVASGTRAVGPQGGFDLTIQIPRGAELGTAELHLEVSRGADKLEGRKYTHELEIQEFRRPEFAVSARADGGPIIQGESAMLTVAAEHFAGGSLVGAEAKWSVYAYATSHEPPGHTTYSFGEASPWWYGRPSWLRARRTAADDQQSYTGFTDGSGEHHVRVDLKHAPPVPMRITADATIIDMNRQESTASTAVLVHPASVYVGLRSERSFAYQGEAQRVEAIAVDPDGKVVPGREIVMTAVHLGWPSIFADEAHETPGETQRCVTTSAATAVDCAFAARQVGFYQFTATVVDERRREHRSRLLLWVAGKQRAAPTDELTLIADKEEYAPGDTAKILVMAPFAGDGVLTVRRDGVASARRITLDPQGTTVEVPIDASHVPGVDIGVVAVGALPRLNEHGEPDPALPTRPAHVSDKLRLDVPASGRRLDLSLKPGASLLGPGSETSLEVVVRDVEGKPVAGGEVAIVVVDEAVLALADISAEDDALEDPLDTFFRDHEDRVQAQHSRDSVRLMDPTVLAPGRGRTAQAGEKARSRDGDDGIPDAPDPLIALRTRFDALALFAASRTTDAKGSIRVRYTLPDSLTRYRVMAVAAAGADRFGTAETTITVRLPLMVRPAAPRFLQQGDRFELPFFVQNQTDAPLTVDLAARATNLDLVQGTGRRVWVPANGRAEVRLPAAADRAGTARFQVAVAAGKLADATSGELQVRPPPATEVVVSHGQLDDGAVRQPLILPADVDPTIGGLEISTSASALASLADAALYLVRYPHECNEQVSSRLLALVALRNVLDDLRAPGLPSRSALRRFVTEDIEHLANLQHDDGGWDFWSDTDDSLPYLSVHVTHALVRARRAGFAVSSDVLDSASEHLEQLLDDWDDGVEPRVRRPIQAYALYVRQQLGEPVGEPGRALYGEVALAEHSLETLAWLLPVLGDSPESAAIVDHLAAQAHKTADAIHFIVDYGASAPSLLHSADRADGVLLEALLTAAPRSDLIPGLVRGLLARGPTGRWRNTQENAFDLLALARYLKTHERGDPAFVARAWLGDKSAVEHAFRDRKGTPHRIDIPMHALLREGAPELVLGKTGPGRLFYRIALRHAVSGPVPAADHGFVVERRYAALDRDDDVRRDPDGTWRLRASARVRVDLSVTHRDPRYHVALVDPLPAGLEPINPALATAGARGDADSWSWWFDHDNLRDDRVEAFAAELPGGAHTYSYIARATTPGTFTAPPTRAEEMYAPEQYGHSASDRVIVE
jgi:hypothetical protein